jgi:hypothetical protein
MRMVFGAAAATLVVCLSLAGPALGQGLPSDVEDKLGLRKNASRAEVERALSDYQRSGRRLPPETEQKLRVWMSRQGSDDGPRRGSGGFSGPGSPGRPSDFGGPPRRSERDYERDDYRDRCERRAERRGLHGREFRDYVRWCLERG